jgi:DNA polymerase-3 subunit alpha
MGIPILPPDVNSSELGFRPEAHCIRFALGSIKNVGEAVVHSVIAALQQQGRFSSFENFSQIGAGLLNKRVVESLIKAGALDSLGMKRAQMMATLGDTLQRNGRHKSKWPRVCGRGG